MGECIDNIGFIFSKVKISIKNRCLNYKIASFKLNKEDFVSSTLNISTSYDDAWINFKNNIINLINSLFVISVTKVNRLHSFGAKLIKIKDCKCCDNLKLYFNFNIIPNTVNTKSCNTCIPLVENSNVPNTSCFPPNYWPDNNTYTVSPSANIVCNNFYELESITYTDVKFYYNNLYCNQVCFA
jgi:hypothetical protein